MDTVNTVLATSTVWAIDPHHSTVEFAVKHLRFASVRGRFTAITGTISTPEDDFTRGKVTATIMARSIDTREPARDTHLRSNDFLGANDFPVITYESTRIEPITQDQFAVHGTLTMKGVTRPVILNATFNGTEPDQYGKTIAAWSATTEIVREEWGVSFNTALETGGVLVGSRVKITLDIAAIRQRP